MSIDVAMSEPDFESPNVYFDALLKPNQSLSKRAFAIVMTTIIILNLISATVFLSSGALPIVGFLGLDVLAVWLAFRTCFRQQKQWTRVNITADRLRVDHLSHRGDLSYIEIPTAFARVDLKEPLSANSFLTLSHRRESWVIGRFLTVDERKSLAEAIRSAIREALAERKQSEA